MKVKINKSVMVNFGDVKEGQVFVWDEKFYLAYLDENNEISAISLRTARECYFSTSTSVFLVDAEIVIG